MDDGLAAFAETVAALPDDRDDTIAFLKAEVSRLQDRVSQLGAQIAERESWQTRYDDGTWDWFRRKPKSVPKGRT